MTEYDIKGYLKNFSNLPQAQGQICMMPGAQRNIKTFIQHICDRIRCDLPPEEVLFAPAMQIELLNQRNGNNECDTS